jgi:hypothetical protein
VVKLFSIFSGFRLYKKLAATKHIYCLSLDYQDAKQFDFCVQPGKLEKPPTGISFLLESMLPDSPGEINSFFGKFWRMKWIFLRCLLASPERNNFRT